jgi:phage-related protein
VNTKWKLIYWESERGKSPVYEFVEGLEEKQQSKIYNSLNLLEEYGTQIGSTHSKKLSDFDFWELRIIGSDNLRIFYIQTSKNSFLLLHAVKKKSQKTSRKDLKVTQNRLEYYLSRIHR